MAPREPIAAGVVDDWRARQRALTELEHRGEPEGWQWLCRIRLRILGYLLARYGDEAPTLLESSAAPPDTPPPGHAAPASPMTVTAYAAPEPAVLPNDPLTLHPPRRAPALSAPLHRIAENHEPVRAAFWYTAELERQQAERQRAEEAKRIRRAALAQAAEYARREQCAERRRELGWRWFFTCDR